MLYMYMFVYEGESGEERGGQEEGYAREGVWHRKIKGKNRDKVF